MRVGILEKMMCPRCRGERLSLKPGYSEDRLEVSEGTIACEACNTAYAIKGGVIDMAPETVPEVKAEVAGNILKSQERLNRYDDSWLLSLPDGFASEPERTGEEFDHHNFFQMMDEAGLRDGDVVLDIGCGTTWTTNEMAKRTTNAIASDISTDKYIGLDSARVFIEKYGRFYERVRFDMCSIPFRDSSFDVTVNEASLHHAHDLGLALKEISRVLKKSGRAVFINEPVSSVLDLRKPSERHGHAEREKYGWNENKYSLLEYSSALGRAGLRLEKILYPESVRRKLFSLPERGKGRGARTGLKYTLGRLLASPYSGSALFRTFTERVLFYPMLLYGIPLCAIVVKKQGAAARE